MKRLKNFFWKTFFCGDRLKNFCEDLFFFFFEIAKKIFVKTFFFFGEHLCLCPWSLALASDFFVSLALASSLVSSTPPLLGRFAVGL